MKHNDGTCSGNHCSGKANSITYCECVCVCSLRHAACNAYAPYYIVWLYNIISTLKKKTARFLKGEIKFWNIRFVFWLSLRLLPPTFLILRKIQRAIIQKCVSVFTKSTCYSCQSSMKLEFFRQFWPCVTRTSCRLLPDL